MQISVIDKTPRSFIAKLIPQLKQLMLDKKTNETTNHLKQVEKSLLLFCLLKNSHGIREEKMNKTQQMKTELTQTEKHFMTTLNLG